MSIRSIMLALAVLTLTGCAVWTRLDAGPLTHGGVTIVAPTDWVHLNARKEGILITRDGAMIQSIQTDFMEGDKIFPKTRQAFAKGTPPQDLAQHVIGEMRQLPGMSGLEVKQVDPATVAGRPGFRVLTEWRNERGATYQRVVAGAEVDGGLLVVQYQALKRYFFARDLGEFERILGSAKRG
jgi:hypothetical protein